MSKNLTKSKPNKVGRITQSRIVTQQHYSGPIPQPLDLQKYEDIKIGFAERIVKMAENESKHRQNIDYKIINSERIFSILGLLAATCVGLSVIVLMWYAFSKGYAEQVKWIGVSIASVIGLFIYKRKQNTY